MAYVCRERLTDDVYLLLVKGLGNLKQALVVVTFFAKNRQNEHAKGVDAEA